MLSAYLRKIMLCVHKKKRLLVKILALATKIQFCSSCPDVPLFTLQAKDTEIRGTKFVVAELKEGGLYRFRVRAVNAAGVGEPGLVSELIEVKDRTSKLLIHL